MSTDPQTSHPSTDGKPFAVTTSGGSSLGRTTASGPPNLDAGDKLVVGMFVKGRGKGSGVEVSLRYWNVLWVEEGKAVRWVEFLDREDALEAAGLRE